MLSNKASVAVGDKHYFERNKETSRKDAHSRKEGNQRNSPAEALALLKGLGGGSQGNSASNANRN